MSTDIKMWKLIPIYLSIHITLWKIFIYSSLNSLDLKLSELNGPKDPSCFVLMAHVILNSCTCVGTVRTYSDYLLKS